MFILYNLFILQWGTNWKNWENVLRREDSC